MSTEKYTLPGGQEVTLDDLLRYAYTTGYFLEERLDPLQLALDQMFANMAPRTRMFLLASRKIGKTYGLMAYADKQARRNRDWIIRFAYPTETQGKTIILPIMEELQRDCPLDLRWVNREAQEKCWVLPHTGSRLYLAGTDTADQVDRLRGPRANLIVLDELPTFRGDLRYLINSVLWPQTLNTGGLLLMSGTPPSSMAHPSVAIIKHAQRRNRLVTKTIFDNPRLTPENIRTICEEANPDEEDPAEIDKILAGTKEGTPDWEREFKCRMIADKNLQVTPEFVRIDHEKEFEVPRYCYKFAFLDPGHVKDHFGATFAVIDFAAQRLLVCRDYKGKRKTTDDVIADCVEIEKELGWNQQDDKIFRYIDATAQQMAADFNKKRYRVSLAAKSPGKAALVTELRNRLNADQVLIHPRCKDLVMQLENGIWKDSAKDDFDRTPEMGHLDVLDSLAQGAMTINMLGKWRLNPAPQGVYVEPGEVSPALVHHPSAMAAVVAPSTMRLKQAWRKTFGIRRQYAR